MQNEKAVSPDFLIIGAMKGGTSTIVDLLNQHPDITLPNKELYYFSNSKNYPKGDEWYSSQIREGIDLSKKIVGEKCVGYSFIDKTASRIHKYKSDIKFIWVLRNPVIRTYSNYLHNFYNGLDTLSFEEAIEQEENRITQNIFLGYKRRSNYLSQFKNYLNYFDKSQFLFLEFDELILNQNNVANRILNFIGASPFDFQNVHSNKTTVTVFPKLIQFAINKYGYWSNPHKLIRKIKYPLFIKSVPKMNKQTEIKLSEYFYEHNIELSKLIELDCTKWNLK
jgi:hypothetical protein